MKQVLIGDGVRVEDVPAPTVAPGTVLVRVNHSCISVGTELAGVRSSDAPLWRRVLEDPTKLRRAADKLVSEGIAATWQAARGEATIGLATGYSAAGTVIEVGEGIDDLAVGDRVACAGAGHANHAEIIRVPRNLVALVPKGLDLPSASMTTIAAIALQGVRRARPTLGETFVVLGLGLIGQLSVQLLKADGCQVVGADINRDRVELAREMGADAAILSGEDPTQEVARLTSGIGADGVIITASGSSSEIASVAFRMCRKKGRVVLVGDVGLDLKREDIYSKELDFLVSTSYGPGRYDRLYEEGGLDYPVGYVRWTENRNMEAVLQLMSEGHLRTAPLVGAVYDVVDARAAYAELEGDARPLSVLLRYPERRAEGTRRVANPNFRPVKGPRVRLALVGAGGFARGTHLPTIRSLDEFYDLRAVVSDTGANATEAARAYGAAYATTDFEEVVSDEQVDAVLIATRHNLHASMTIRALNAGKHVLVEKPLALLHEELESVVSAIEGRSDAPMLLTGFNRRFAPHVRELQRRLADRTAPFVAVYRMNAGYIPSDNWVHGPEGGGRNIGEACHIYDLFTALTGTEATDVAAVPITRGTGQYRRDDNFVVTIRFECGSVCTLTYTALGHADHPKEHLEVFSDGRVHVLNDFRSLVTIGDPASDITTRGIDKGHKQELAAFAKAVLEGDEWPIPLWQQVQAMQIAFQVEGEIRT